MNLPTDQNLSSPQSTVDLRRTHTLDAGLNVFSSRSVPSKQLSLDLDYLLDQSDAQAQLQLIDSFDLYKALKKRGLEDCLDILPLISTEQMTTLFDLEAWSDDGELLLESSLEFLNILKMIEPAFLAQTFKSLDEEYQLGLLDGQVETVEREVYDKLSDVEQDKLTPLPGEDLFYRVKSEDPEVNEVMDALIEGMLSLDVAYAVSLLSHATYVPPLEQKSLAAQFRMSRLSEFGFVPYEESLQVFRPLSRRFLYTSIATFKSDTSIPVKNQSTSTFFLDEVFSFIEIHADFHKVNSLRHDLLYFSNMLASACRVSPDNLHGLQAVLDRARGMISFSLEKTSNGNLSIASEILFSRSPKEIFQNTISEVDEIRYAILAHMAKSYPFQAEKLRALLNYRRHGEILNFVDISLLDIYGFETCELLKALFNRFPAALIEKNLNERQRFVFRTVSSIADFHELENFLAYFKAEN